MSGIECRTSLSNAKSKDVELNDRGRGIGEKGSIKDNMKVWDLVYPDRESLTKLTKSALSKKSVRKKLSWRDRIYLKALFKASWNQIRSRVVLEILAPMVEKMLKALGREYEKSQLEYEGTMDKEEVKGLLSMRLHSAYKMMRGVAEEISRLAQGWGNKLARKWSEDPGFIKYLMMMNLPQNKNIYLPFTIR